MKQYACPQPSTFWGHQYDLHTMQTVSAFHCCTSSSLLSVVQNL